MGRICKRSNHETYIAAGAMTADITGDWIGAEDQDELAFFAQFEDTGTPVGNLYVEWRKNAGWNPVRIPLDRVSFSGAPGASHTAGDAAVAIDGTADTTLAIVIAQLGGEYRLFFDRTSGGDANTSFKAGYLLKRYN